MKITKNREFFVMTPDDAYELLESIAKISDTESKLKKYKDEIYSDKNRTKRPQIDFFKCGLHVGNELVYTEDNSIKVIVQRAHKVLYNNELTSLSAIVRDLKQVKSIDGPSYFTFNEELITDIAERTQWKDY